MSSPSPLRADALTTIALGGLAIGVLDGIFASTFYPAVLGAEFSRIWKGVATGVVGPAARTGGTEMVALGLLMHFVVATCIATTFLLLTRLLPVLLRQAVLSGLCFGLMAWAGMQFVVIPLSRIPTNKNPPPRRPEIVACELAGHAFLVGLPVALIARRSAQRRAGA